MNGLHGAKTNEVREAVLQNLRAGLSQSQASAKAGISRQTLRLWRKADKAFDDMCDAAEAEGIAPIETALIEQAKSCEDQAVALAARKYILERRKPTREDYAPQSHNHPFLAIQHNYLNPVAAYSPPIALDKPQSTVIDVEPEAA